MQLDENQTRAVTSDSKRILACSVPGSGKTTVLTARIGNMVHERKFLPSRICAITFTRLGAAEIRRRLEPGCNGVYVGTLHALCLRIVREFGSSAGYESSWLSLVDDDEASLDLREVLCDLQICRRNGNRSLRWVAVGAEDWERFYSNVTSGRITVDPGTPDGSIMWTAYQVFLGRLRSQNVLTFNTLLCEAYRILCENPDALAHWQRNVQHVLVDEAQDTSQVQWSIVWRLIERADPETLFVVGDDDQSIYSWRGAEPREMIDLSRKDGVEVIALSNTYRFGDGIGGPCSALISCNRERIEKHMECYGRVHGKVEWSAASLHGLGAHLRLLMSKIDAGDRVAVLGRTHDILRRLSGVLRDAGVEHLKIGRSADIRKMSAFRAVMGYLRLVCNKFDRRASAAICAMEGIDEEKMLAIRELAAAGDGVVSGSFVDALGHTMPMDLGEALMVIRRNVPESEYAVVAQWFSDAEANAGLDLSDVRAVVDYVALVDVQDDLVLNPDARLVLATIHATKGLEFDYVVMLGMNENHFPTEANLVDGRIEEERRLAYVGMTRAKKHVHLVTLCKEDFGPMGRLVTDEPSLFVREALKIPYMVGGSDHAT